MAGIVRQIIGKLSSSKKKGAAYVEELNAALSPEAIASEPAVVNEKK